MLTGTGSCALQDATKLTKVSIDAGIYAVLVLPPFYYKPQNDESVIRFYSELIGAVNDPKLRIIFYNFPKFTGYNFDHNVIGKMKKLFGELAAGIKDSSSNWENMVGVTQNVSDFKGLFWDRDIFTGDFVKWRSRLYNRNCKFDCN